MLLVHAARAGCAWDVRILCGGGGAAIELIHRREPRERRVKNHPRIATIRRLFFLCDLRALCGQFPLSLGILQ